MKRLIRRVGERLGKAIKHEISSENRGLVDEHLSMRRKHAKYTFGDQKGQVDFLINNVLDYENKGLKKNGFFIDLACADGVHINNTYFLEKYLNWGGLLFEVNPNYWSSIEKNRSSLLIKDCVADVENRKVDFRIDNGMLGGIVSEETDNSWQVRGEQLETAEIISLRTTTLAAELSRNDAPKLIDFMSLDVEGAEYLILKNFPFDNYKFRSMSIERPNRELDILLDIHGYRQVAHMSYDVMYVHQDFLGDVNLCPDLKFSFTPPKDW